MFSVDWRKLEDVPSVAPWLTVASSVRGEDDNKPRVSHSISDNEDVTERESICCIVLYVRTSAAGNRNIKLLGKMREVIRTRRRI